MSMGFAPTWLRQVSPPASQNHFNHCGKQDFIKLFQTSNIKIVKCCQSLFGCELFRWLKIVKYTLVSTYQVSLLTGSLRSFYLQMSMLFS